METHHHVSEGLIAILTYPELSAENFSDPWTDERTVRIEVPSKDLVFVGPATVNVRPTQALTRTKSTDSLNKYIAEQMSELPVERVYSKYDGRVFYTWVVIEDRDPVLQRKIYAIEAKIVNRFKEFGFDFYIIYRAGNDIENQISGGIELVFKRR